MAEASKDNPDRSTGYWCGHCGAAMRLNVLRLGPAAGFVHVATDSPLCEAERVAGPVAKRCPSCGRYFDKPECPWCAETRRRSG